MSKRREGRTPTTLAFWGVHKKNWQKEAKKLGISLTDFITITMNERCNGK